MEVDHQTHLDLNYLYTVNADRARQYANAHEEVGAAALQEYFSYQQRLSASFQQELEALIRTTNGTLEEGTTVSGSLYNLWIDLRAALSGGKPLPLIRAVQCAERANVARYEELLADSGHLPEEIRAVLERQLWQYRNALRTLDDLEKEHDTDHSINQLNNHADRT